MGSSPIRVLFSVPNILRHPYKKDPKRDPNFENYPYRFYVRRGFCNSNPSESVDVQAFANVSAQQIRQVLAQMKMSQKQKTPESYGP